VADILDVFREETEQIIKFLILEELFHGGLGILVEDFADDTESGTFLLSIIIFRGGLLAGNVLLLLFVQVYSLYILELFEDLHIAIVELY